MLQVKNTNVSKYLASLLVIITCGVTTSLAAEQMSSPSHCFFGWHPFELGAGDSHGA